jgi:acyl-CoA carboxylase epsilon subunit-like protein
MLRVVRGVPTDEELAALVGVLAVVRRPAPASRAPRSAWSRRAGQLRSGQLHAAPNAWHDSALPM